jgi:ABC-type amino acid transport substrate-binding protein
VVRGYNLENELAESGIKTVTANRDRQGMRMLLRDRVKVFATFRDTGFYVLSKLGVDTDFNYVEVRNSPYFACFNKTFSSAHHVVEKFNKALAVVIADGSRDRILQKYK